MPAIAIEASGLTKWFGADETKTMAVRDFSFQAYFGEMLFVVGPSGSGKTTLLSMISGILRPNSGTVKIENLEIWSLSTNDIADFRLRKVGFVFQDYHLFPRLTTVENVAICSTSSTTCLTSLKSSPAGWFWRSPRPICINCCMNCNR
jgi:putative ABC transport system ATP-binding protein